MRISLLHTGFIACIIAEVSSSPFLTERVGAARATFYLNNPQYATCNTEDGREGYCLFQGCFVNDLRYKGRCGFGLGSCCLAEQSCLRTTNVNNTYFVNPGFPQSTTSLGSCEMIIKRRTPDICQIRLDFIDMELEQPDQDGNCLNDIFRINGTKSKVPELCGSNKGQHLYFDVDPLEYDSPVSISVTINELTLLPRSWNIKVTQIGCGVQEGAPSGCLQYFSGKTGTVSSFNFANEPTSLTGTRQLANTAYSVCVRQENGYCGITWYRNQEAGPTSFTVTGDVNSVPEELLGTPLASLRSCADSDDFVLIPNGYDETGQLSERMCGLGFPSNVTTYMTPFILHARTGPSETGNSLNNGFNLRYKQQPC